MEHRRRPCRAARPHNHGRDRTGRRGAPFPRRGAPSTLDVKILGDLSSRLAGSDHKHVTVRELMRTAVVRRVDLQDLLRQLLRESWNGRNVVAADRDDDLIGVHRSGGCLEIETVQSLKHARHRNMLANRRIEAIRIPPDEVVHLVALHEAVGIVAVVGESGQGALPVRGYEGEVVPAGVLPLVCDGGCLQYDVFYPALSQVPADRQTCLTSAYDDHRMALAHSNSAPDIFRTRTAPVA